MRPFRDSFASLLAASLLAAAGLAASCAAAQERCSGTLCDLYYGAPSPDPSPTAKPAPPTPVMVPSGGILGFFSGGSTQPAAPGTPAARPMVGVGGGGLAAMARGEPAERCTGTLCDFLYGGPPPEKPATPPADATAAPQSAAAEPQNAPEADPDVAPEPTRPRRTIARDETPRCAPTVQDPWRCYR